MRKSGILTVLLLFVSMLHAAPVLYDDFESYDLGAVADVTGGMWVPNPAPVAVAMPALGNKVCEVDGGDVYTTLGDFAIPNTDTETTVFFRVYADGTENSIIGVGDDTDTTPDNYDDLDAFVRFSGGNISARDSGSYPDLITGISEGWYNVWLVVNASIQTYDVYINQGTDNATNDDKLGIGFGFRNPTGSDILVFGSVYGAGLIFDDVYITTGLDLTNPPILPTAPDAYDMTRYLWDAELTVENGGFALPASTSDGLIDVPGWDSYGNEPWHGDTGTRTGADTDGDGWYWSQNVNSTGDPMPIWNITSTPMVEGVTYAFTADVQGRWDCDQATLSVVTGPYTGSDPNAPAGGGDPNVALVSQDYTVGGNDVYYPLSISYTATAADEGNLIGLSVIATGTSNPDNCWMRLDNVHLYEGYLAVHGAQDPTPANEATSVAPGTVSLSWTPSNDPNVIGQKLYYYVDDYLNFADITGYNSSETWVSLSGSAGSQDITADYDQYVIWRVDTVTDANTFTGESWYFIDQFTDKVPDIQEWEWYHTWIDEPTTLWADVNDFGEDDIDAGSFVWTVTVGDPNLVITGTDSSDLARPEATVVADAIGDYEVTLVVTDIDGQLGPQESNTATYQVHVHEDACAAAIASGFSYSNFDSDEDCDVDMTDFAAFAAKWLEDIKLETPFEY